VASLLEPVRGPLIVLRGGRAIAALGLVEDSLRDLAFADLAPFPPVVPDQVIEMLQGHPHGTKPNLRFVVADFLQFRAARKVQQIGRRAYGMGLAVGFRDRPMENESHGFQPRLNEFLG
jgi:hypothetical protein